MWQAFNITHSPPGGKRCHSNAANTLRQPQTFRQPSEWLRGKQLMPTQTHKRQCTAATATTQHHSVPQWKADCEGYFWRAWKTAGRLWGDGGSGCPQAGTAGTITHTGLYTLELSREPILRYRVDVDAQKIRLYPFIGCTYLWSVIFFFFLL